MRRSPFASLRFYLIVLVLLAVVPALGVALHTASEGRQREAVDIQENALRLAQLIASQEEQLIEGTSQLLRVLADFPAVRNSDPAECSALFAQLLRHYHRYANFGAARPNGDVFCSALPLNGPVNIADRAYFRRALETRDFAIGDYQVGRITGKPTLNFGYPVLDDAGQVRAVVFVALDLVWFNQLESEVEAQLPPGATFTKLDHNGLVIAHYPDPEQWVGQPAPEMPFLKIILPRHQGVIETSDSSGTPHLYAITPVRSALSTSTGIYVILGIPAEAAFTEINRTLARQLTALGVVTVLGLAATWIGSEVFILRRTRALLEATRRLSAGDLSARTGLPHGLGEIGQIARAFDEMAESLQTREVERKRAEEALQASKERLELLYRLGLSLTESLDIHEVAQRALDALCTAVSSQRGTILVPDPDIHHLRVIAASGYGKDSIDVLNRRWCSLSRGGLAGWVAVHRQPARVDDVSKDSRWEAAPGIGEWVRSALSVPLVHRDELVGVLVTSSDQEGFFTEEHAQLASLIATTLAAALVNARLYDDARQHAREMYTLNQVGQKFAATLDEEEIIETLGREAGHLLRPGNFTVCLYDEARSEIEGKLYLDCGERKPGFRIPFGQGLTSYIISHNESILATDYLRECEQRHLEVAGPGEPAKAWLGVPVATRERVLGALIVWDYQREGSLGERDLRVLSTLAAQAAIAIENARLYASLQKTNAQLQAALQAKDEMIANVSHELRTPLAIILGYAEMLGDAILGPLTPEQERAMQVIYQQGERLRFMVNRLLTLQTFDASVLRKVQLELDSWLREIVQPWKERAAKAGIQIQLELSSLPTPLMTDPEFLGQVIDNLLDNAIKFSPNGGVIQVRSWTEGNETLIAVTDQGIGIPPDKLGQMFERFYQVDGSSTRRFGGMGIGLALCQVIVEAHGGRIWAASEGEGRGSTFYVALPVATA